MARYLDLRPCSNEGLTRLAHRLGKVFQAASVLSNVHVALDKIVKLSFRIHDTMEFIVTELGMDAIHMRYVVGCSMHTMTASLETEL